MKDEDLDSMLRSSPLKSSSSHGQQQEATSLPAWASVRQHRMQQQIDTLRAGTPEALETAALWFDRARWDDAQGVELCEAMRYAHVHGGLQNLKQLTFAINRLGDAFVKAFVALLDEGGLENLVELDLAGNAISDEGMLELASAIERGGLPSCTSLYVYSNPGEGKPVLAANVSKCNRA